MSAQNPPAVQALPKVELHVHIEGTITPAKCRELAARNHVALAPGLFTVDGSDYQYSDFLDSVTRVYFGLAATLKTGADYADVTYDYLKRCAEENAVYVELIACPAQCVRSCIAYRDMIDGMAAGIDRARADFGIESRINVTFERDQSLSDAEITAKAGRDADMILSYPHPYVVGLDIAGGEKTADIPPFRAAYERTLREFGRPLGVRMHAAENAGSSNAFEAMRFGVTRIGHGVRTILDPAAIAQLRRDRVMLEVCPTSNVLALKDFCPTYETHPLRDLYDAGLHISLNSDDPGLFRTSIGREYQIAHEKFDFTVAELLNVSQDAVDFSFAPDDVKQKLSLQIGDFRQRFFNRPAASAGKNRLEPF
ncbi:MAG: Adenosine deaminase [Micavibrio sp.]|nr:Adenosine deaminase [Micavibrio sp.]